MAGGRKNPLIEHKIPRPERFHAYLTTSEKSNLIDLSVILGLSYQAVMCEGLKQLYENTRGITTRENIKY